MIQITSFTHGERTMSIKIVAGYLKHEIHVFTRCSLRITRHKICIAQTHSSGKENLHVYLSFTFDSHRSYQ